MWQVLAVIIIATAQLHAVAVPYGPVESYSVVVDSYIRAWLTLPSCPDNATLIVDNVTLAGGTEIVSIDPGPPCNVTLDAPYSMLRAEPGLHVALVLEGPWGRAGLNITLQEVYANTSIMPGSGTPQATSYYEGQLYDTGGGSGLSISVAGSSYDPRMVAALVLGAAALAAAVREYGGGVEGG